MNINALFSDINSWEEFKTSSSTFLKKKSENKPNDINDTIFLLAELPKILIIS